MHKASIKCSIMLARQTDQAIQNSL